MINAKTAKRLRKIAREVAQEQGLDKYKLVASNIRGHINSDGSEAQPPQVMVACERRAYKEAKKVYAGKSITKVEPRRGGL